MEDRWMPVTYNRRRVPSKQAHDNSSFTEIIARKLGTKYRHEPMIGEEGTENRRFVGRAEEKRLLHTAYRPHPTVGKAHVSRPRVRCIKSFVSTRIIHRIGSHQAYERLNLVDMPTHRQSAQLQEARLIAKESLVHTTHRQSND